MKKLGLRLNNMKNMINNQGLNQDLLDCETNILNDYTGRLHPPVLHPLVLRMAPQMV